MDIFANNWIGQLELALLVVIATVIGAAIGAEREISKFIGAGTIFRHRSEDIIEGLTTAASLLLVAALAVTVVVGQVLLAGIVALLSLAILRTLRRFTHRSD